MCYLLPAGFFLYILHPMRISDHTLQPSLISYLHFRMCIESPQYKGCNACAAASYNVLGIRIRRHRENQTYSLVVIH
jgi:hypothetical protein